MPGKQKYENYRNISRRERNMDRIQSSPDPISSDGSRQFYLPIHLLFDASPACGWADHGKTDPQRSETHSADDRIHNSTFISSFRLSGRERVCLFPVGPLSSKTNWELKFPSLAAFILLYFILLNYALAASGLNFELVSSKQTTEGGYYYIILQRT